MHVAISPSAKITTRCYLQQGYTMCVMDEHGKWTPGYSAWVIVYVLDLLDKKHEADNNRLENVIPSRCGTIGQ
jgi:hypothetical protein